MQRNKYQIVFSLLHECENENDSREETNHNHTIAFVSVECMNEVIKSLSREGVKQKEHC